MFDEVDDLQEDEDYYAEEDIDLGPSRKAASERGFLGMTAGQRFLLSILLLIAVLVFGFACLLITQKLWLF
jgi:hypothetical protein